jgi:hypothetical protein
MPKPTLCSEVVYNSKKERRHRVWIVLDTIQYELPYFFRSDDKGFESLAKQVLARLKKTP